MKPQNAIIIDDHRIFSESFCELLKASGIFNIVNNYYSVDFAKDEMQREQYDYMFTDIIMPGFNTIDFIKYARKNWPRLIIIVVSSVADTSTIKEVFGTGANAFLSKSVGSNEIKLAIEKTWMGESYISTDLAGKLANAIFTEEKRKLTKREIEVLKNVTNGYTIAEMAALMHLSEHTIIAHRRNIMEKLGVSSAIELVKYAYDNKLF